MHKEEDPRYLLTPSHHNTNTNYKTRDRPADDTLDGLVSNSETGELNQLKIHLLSSTLTTYTDSPTVISWSQNGRYVF